MPHNFLILNEIIYIIVTLNGSWIFSQSITNTPWKLFKSSGSAFSLIKIIQYYQASYPSDIIQQRRQSISLSRPDWEQTLKFVGLFMLHIFQNPFFRHPTWHSHPFSRLSFSTFCAIPCEEKYEALNGGGGREWRYYMLRKTCPLLNSPNNSSDKLRDSIEINMRCDDVQTHVCIRAITLNC